MKTMQAKRTVRKRALLSALSVALCTAAIAAYNSGGALCAARGVDFVVKPYLQLGQSANENQTEEVRWLTQSKGEKWSLEYRLEGQENWHQSDVKLKPLPTALIQPMYLASSIMTGLQPGKKFEYRVKSGKIVGFAADSMARKDASQPCHFAVMGDLGAGSNGQKKVAYQCFKDKPEFVVMPGDIVYNSGLLSEYLLRFFPVYNADAPSPSEGAPLMRSSIFVPVMGNHDIALGGGYPTNFDKFRDALAYFFVWSAPLNGPLKKPGVEFTPKLGGAKSNHKPFLTSAGSSYPCMANYSFDYGNSHWTVIDGNLYMDWSNPALRQWVNDDLAASKATWKFVTFHQPGFSRDSQHSKEQRMRLLCDVFEKNNVDIVFAGHAHNYQRSFPLKFRPKENEKTLTMKEDGTVDGIIELDKNFNGASNTSPQGVIYIVTGAGGAGLYTARTSTGDGIDFTDKFVDNIHSFTSCDISGGTLSIKQISAEGNVVDRFTLTK